MNQAELIWMNGEFVPWEDAKIHVLTHGLHYGTGVFEGIRCYDTEIGPAIFRHTDHLARFENSAALYGPAKLPREMVDRLHAALMPMLSSPPVLEKMAGQGMTPQPMNGTQLAAWLAAERKRYEVLAKASGYVPETL